jgi:hypothetical protein
VNIGISKDEIAERKLHIHAWRHFFNTELLKGGLTVTQIQAVTGHKSERMTEMYFHFEPGDFKKAMEVQEALLEPITAPKAEISSQNVTVLPFPINQKEPDELRKQA